MIPTLKQHQRILIAPLHWGLGHATRCIPIIDHLISLEKDIAIAGDSASFQLLKRRYPDLPAFELPAYNVKYSDNMALSIFLQGPKFMMTYCEEIKATHEIVNQWKPDVIISDNRFGVRNKETHNIYLTHQLNIQHQNKIVAQFANYLHQRYIHRFDECWIPDYPDQKMSGRLSDSKEIKIDTTFIGALTRLKIDLTTPNCDLLILLSGPEPSRTNLEKKLVKNLSSRSKKITLVRGITSKRLADYPEEFDVYDIVDEIELTKLINRAAQILCRSGYSTIMDLQDYPRPKYYIPTKGQTEQEYLAKFHNGKNNVLAISDVSQIKN